MTPPPETALSAKRIAELERLAKAATPGPYFVQGKGCQGPHRFIRIASSNSPGQEGIPHGVSKMAHHNAEANADYFAALDPATVLALLSALKAQEWQGIDSCPSDGSDIWAFRPGWYDAIHNVNHEPLVERSKADGRWWRSGHLRHPPTQWMPDFIPSPPTKAEEPPSPKTGEG
ncbi:hypothetical protein UFOVP1169_43 [uncultured Caudovirales phage]|uniref:Uncharacterized protein n=1 Tax=uncultured Caudovirales phage TaxID=2100421 RepID=A0A6J5QZJ0_9CAUD|nr:hypothetical protein UFOVP1169_43 [uncultured Caudovirales phage]